jgi:hypothetical protein
MTSDADLLDQARQVDIRGLASRYVQLRRVSAVDFAGPCPTCGGRDRFVVNTRKMVWHCRGCGKGGDAIALAQHVEGLSFRDAVAHLTGEPATPMKPRPAPQQSSPRADEADKRVHEFNLKIAASIVSEIVPIIGPPGEQYLHDIRKINTDAIADVLSSTYAIGWHSGVLFREDGHPLDGQRIGAIIGIMTDPVTARPTGGISRTYIGSDGKKVGKAKNLGPAGIVRLTPDEDVSHGLFLAEGLETALAVMSKGLRPAWSTGSTSIMAKLPVLGGIESLTILADNDENGAGERAANEAERRWRAAGREVRVWIPPTRGDFNDLLMRGAL